MLIGLFPPQVRVGKSKWLPVLCRAVNQCNPGDACSGQLAGRITYNCDPLQGRTPMGQSQSAASPASCASSPAGLWSNSFCFLPWKTFMYHISGGKGRCREKAILAYSKRHTRGLCLSTTEYLSQAGGKSKPLCAFTTKNMLLFKNGYNQKKKKQRGEEKKDESGSLILWHTSIRGDMTSNAVCLMQTGACIIEACAPQEVSRKWF